MTAVFKKNSCEKNPLKKDLRRWPMIIISLSLLILVSFLLGCQQDDFENNSEVLVVGIEGEPSHINPLYATDANGQNLGRLVFNGLVRIDDDMIPAADLAKSFKVENKLNYSFTLRKGVLFHDGSEMSSEDVVASIEAFQDPEFKSPFKGAFTRIKDLKAPDQHTIRFRTDKVEPGLLVDLALLKILPKEVFQKENFESLPASKIPGTGPYIFQSQKQGTVELKRFDSYFGARHGDTAEAPRIQIKVIKDQTTRYLKLLRGEVDIAYNNLSPRKVALAEDEEKLKVKTAPGVGYNYIGMNLELEMFQDPKVRKALAHALNIERVIKYKLKGYARRANSVLAPEFYFHKDTGFIEYDPKKAAKLLDEAGYPKNEKTGKRDLSFVWKTSNNRFSVKVARIFADMFEELGIQVNVQSFEWGTFYGDIKSGNFEMYSLRWIGHVGPEFLYDLYHSTANVPEGFHKPYFNRVGYENPRLDSLLRKGMNLLKAEKRKKYFDKAQEIIARELPYISLWYPDITAVFRPHLKNVKLHPTGNWKILAKISEKS
jgi:peptide/nickel transport system substrate-binding protein